jgi:hypothetical protein
MAEHQNAALVKNLFAAFRRAEVSAVRELIADDATWTFPGLHGRLAGEHRGFDAILRFLLDVQSLTDGTFHLDLEDVVANDERAIVLFRGQARRGDKTLDNPTCLVVRISGGKAVEFREFVWDLFDVDEFWS